MLEKCPPCNAGGYIGVAIAVTTHPGPEFHYRWNIKSTPRERIGQRLFQIRLKPSNDIQDTAVKEVQNIPCFFRHCDWSQADLIGFPELRQCPCQAGFSTLGNTAKWFRQRHRVGASCVITQTLGHTQELVQNCTPTGFCRVCGQRGTDVEIANQCKNLIWSKTAVLKAHHRFADGLWSRNSRDTTSAVYPDDFLLLSGVDELKECCQSTQKSSRKNRIG